MTKTKRLKKQDGQTLQLQNPVADHYDTFIVGNAVSWQVRAMAELQDVLDAETHAELTAMFNAHRAGFAFTDPTFHDFVEPFARKYVVEEGSATGQHVVICGAGPSLREHAAEWCPQADQVWGCNSALPWLIANGHRATHGFTVDQTPHMLDQSEWYSAPDVEYLLATTVHPHLTDWLMGKERRIRYFHNYVGIRKPHVTWVDEEGKSCVQNYEEWLYALLFPATIRSGSGLNAVTRAIDVATFMGAEKITVLGADCSLRWKGKPRPDLVVGSPEQIAWLKANSIMHADGNDALASEASCVVLWGKIDQRWWLTKADMVITAQWLMRMARDSKGVIQLIGDTLPNALEGKSEAFLSRLPNFIDSTGKQIRVTA